MAVNNHGHCTLETNLRYVLGERKIMGRQISHFVGDAFRNISCQLMKKLKVNIDRSLRSRP